MTTTAGLGMMDGIKPDNYSPDHIDNGVCLDRNQEGYVAIEYMT